MHITYTQRMAPHTHTAIRIGLASGPVLVALVPGALVLGRRHGALSDAIATLVAILGPLAAVDLPSDLLHAQTMTASVLPLALVVRAAVKG